MEGNPASDWGVWTAPESPVTIGYSRQALDEIRLAVTDAFFSLPRGGAEIGGILLGRHEGRRVTIQGHRAHECEHAFGPSFALSPKDFVRLAGLLFALPEDPSGLEAVGWYHSHTRSEIFLSDADQAIHRQYFPEPWQVALVLKPHTFQPTRAKFFFREANGSIRGEAAAAGEFLLQPAGAPQPPQDVEEQSPAAMPAMRSEPEPDEPPSRHGSDSAYRTIAIPAERRYDAAQPEAPAAAARQPAGGAGLALAGGSPPAVERPAETLPVELPPPKFTQVGPSQQRGWIGSVLAVLAGLAIGSVAYATREYWLPPVASWVRPMGSPAASSSGGEPGAANPYIGLRTIDTDGQLWILWDRGAPAVRGASGATLLIHDGPETRSIELDGAHVQAGSFTYGREGERIDITLTLNEPNGEKPREVATYLGRLPPRIAGPGEGQGQDREKLADDLKAERARSKKLQRSLDDAVTRMRQEQQKKRLDKQAPDADKQ